MQLPAHELPAFISKCLQEGFTNVEIADALGCTESYISQLIAANPALQAAAQVVDTRYEDIDNLYIKLELRALQELEKRMSLVSKPMELVRIAQAINSAKRRGSAPKGALEHSNAPIVNITVPQQVAVQQFQFNAENQAIAITGDNGQQRALITASSKQLSELSAMMAKDAAQAQALPQPINKTVAQSSLEDM